MSAATLSGAAAPRPAGATLASPLRIRLLAFAGLAVFGALHWAALMRPLAAGRMLLCAAIALAVLLAARHAASGRSRVARVGLALVGGVLVLGAILLAAGVPVRLLAPRQWGELVSGIGQGIDALPGIGVPYRGVDPWVRVDLLASGALVLVLAALLEARALRRDRRGVRAALVLAAVFVIPIVEHSPPRPFLWGAVFTVLFGGLLWADRIERAYLPGAALFVTVALGAGLLAAPRLDTDGPWLHYSAIIESLTGTGGIVYDWNHGYGPLDWPRRNREVLRIEARTPAYWKAVDLDRFDGLHWTQSSRPAPGPPIEIAPNHADWQVRMRVTVRDLRTRAYITAGTGMAIEHSPRYAIPAAAGTFATGSEPLRKGDTYLAEVYAPHPSIRELRDAGTAYPVVVRPYLTMDLPPAVGGPDTAHPGAPTTLGPTELRFAPFSVLSARTPPLAVDPYLGTNNDGGALLLASQYRDMYDLARRLRARTFNPYDYLRAIEERLSKGYVYSEKPPKPAAGRPPLVSFLFDTKTGYCQQFSGAMTLLLRMGGVPARVGSGFTPGTYDKVRREWVVRDVDAHSWVEVYFPQLGWVTFDPTPGEAPPRTQLVNEPLPLSDREIPLRTDPRRADVPRRPGGAGSDAAGEQGTVSIWLVLLVGLVVGSLAAALAFAVRSRRRTETVAPELAELVRALRLTGREIEPALTLRALEERFRRDAPGAARYVAAVRMARFAGRAAGPTGEDRAALREALASGLGWTGRLRAWRALPPEWLRPHPVYTGR